MKDVQGHNSVTMPTARVLTSMPITRMVPTLSNSTRAPGVPLCTVKFYCSSKSKGAVVKLLGCWLDSLRPISDSSAILETRYGL
mgnify:CR=1 FL=1